MSSLLEEVDNVSAPDQPSALSNKRIWTQLTIFGCLILTAVVVHTAIRIEHVNQQVDTFLPRAPGYETMEWQVPPLDDVLAYVDNQIAKQRSNVYVQEHPGEEVPPTESFLGAPYSPKEVGIIDRQKRFHANFNELHWWVNSFGAVQYCLAPLAFMWSIGNLLALKSIVPRLLSTSCAGLAFIAIFLMILRGY